MGDWPNEGRLSKLAIIRQCEASLRRLQTDRIDLYQMHHIDRDAWWDEIWEAMEHLKQQGKILYVGSSNFAGWHIARANEIAGYRHSLGLATEQSRLQPERADDRARGDPRRPRVRDGLDPATARSRAACSPARWRRSRRAAAPTDYMHEEIEQHRAQLERWEAAVQGARRASRRRRARVAAAQPGRHGAHHRAAHRGAAARLACARSTITLDDEVLRRSTRSSPAPAAPRPRPTPGSSGGAQRPFDLPRRLLTAGASAVSPATAEPPAPVRRPRRPPRAATAVRAPARSPTPRRPRAPRGCPPTRAGASSRAGHARRPGSSLPSAMSDAVAGSAVHARKTLPAEPLSSGSAAPTRRSCGARGRTPRRRRRRAGRRRGRRAARSRP